MVHFLMESGVACWLLELVTMNAGNKLKAQK